MNKKRCAVICADIAKQQGHDSWDVGRIQLMEDMYEACLKAGRIKKRDKHPLIRMKRISKILAEDAKRVDGVWCCYKTLTYPGIIKKPVNFYELRENYDL